MQLGNVQYLQERTFISAFPYFLSF